MGSSRVARRQHRCTLCGQPIAVGERHTYRRITPWDHPDNESFSDYRAHLACDAFWCEQYGEACDWIFPYCEEAEFVAEMQRWLSGTPAGAPA